MTAHFRTRGIVAVRANADIISEIRNTVTDFKGRYDKRHDEIENAIDDIASQIAALRIGGSGVTDASPAETRKALNAFGEFVKTGKP